MGQGEDYQIYIVALGESPRRERNGTSSDLFAPMKSVSSSWQLYIFIVYVKTEKNPGARLIDLVLK